METNYRKRPPTRCVACGKAAPRLDSLCWCDYCGQNNAIWDDGTGWYLSHMDPDAKKIYRMGTIYFIRQQGLAFVKIGFTGGLVTDRMKQLSTGSPVPLVIERELQGTTYIERDLHRRFADRRVHREWFSLTQQEVLEACQ
jgi:hypothetical protein